MQGREQVWLLVRSTWGRAADSPGHAETSQFCPHPAPQGAPRLPEEVGGWALLGICYVP